MLRRDGLTFLLGTAMGRLSFFSQPRRRKPARNRAFAIRPWPKMRGGYNRKARPSSTPGFWAGLGLQTRLLLLELGLQFGESREGIRACGGRRFVGSGLKRDARLARIGIEI